MLEKTIEEDLNWEKEHVWHPYGAFSKPTPVNFFTKASGVWLHALSPTGKNLRLVDCLSSWWCASFGHDNSKLIAALAETSDTHNIDTIRHVMFAGFTHKPAIAAARALLNLAPKGMEKVFFSDSGSVAVEIALKMALQYQAGIGQTQKTKFACLLGGYHGDTWHTMSVSRPIEGGMHSLFKDVVPKAYALEAPITPYEAAQLDSRDTINIEKLFSCHGKELAAVVLEPIFQGAHGMRFYSPLYLEKLSEVAKKYGTLLIFDEIATGFGRLACPFATNLTNVTPDIMTVGKAMTGGVISLAATLTTNEVAQGMEKYSEPQFMHGPTFMANGIACHVAARAMELFVKDNMIEKAKRLEMALQSIKGVIDAQNNKYIKSCRTLGGVIVVEYTKNIIRDEFSKKAIGENLWMRPVGNIQYAMPPFVLVDDEEALKTFIEGFITVTCECKDFLEGISFSSEASYV